MASLKFYYDFLSQPARAVGLVLESAQIEHEKCYLNIVEGKSWLNYVPMSVASHHCQLQHNTGRMTMPKFVLVDRFHPLTTTGFVYLKGNCVDPLYGMLLLF